MELERSLLVSPNGVLSLVKVSLEANLTEEEEPQWKIRGAGFENDHRMVDPCWGPCRALLRRRSDDHRARFYMTRKINLRQGNWDGRRRIFQGLRDQGL